MDTGSTDNKKQPETETENNEADDDMFPKKVIEQSESDSSYDIHEGPDRQLSSSKYSKSETSSESDFVVPF